MSSTINGQQGDGAGALQAFRKGHAIAEALAARDPANAEWQRNLMVSYAKLAGATEPTDAAAALDWWRKAFEQFDGMKRRGIMLPTDERALAFLRSKVGSEPAEPGTAQHLSPRPDASAAKPPTVGRNDPCPCGSGLKYKQCHGKLA